LFYAILFYGFAIVLFGAALGVIFARNPVHAVMLLVLAFFQSAVLWLLIEVEFLALFLVLVYVGAVMVLFLFVVMMLDVDFAELKAGFIKNAPVGLLVGGIVLVALILLFVARGFDLGVAHKLAAAMPTADSGVSNTEALGQILYTKYIYFFEVAGLILLVAMIGAIVLTLQHKIGVRRQSIAAQVARSPKDGVEVVKVPSGGSVIPAPGGQS